MNPALVLALLAAPAETWTKQHSAFYPADLLAHVRANVERYPWAGALRDDVLRAAAPWHEMTNRQLWDLMFGPTITRAWMVWSNGWCPACRQPVVMYNWEVDALARPWKVRCPHCQAIFPTNDFAAYYRSGLDSRGVFQPDRADRGLLFNAEHPDPNDPLHRFGVDDGEGYVDGERRWRFIGAYLIYGQWKHAVLSGIHYLAAAYGLTGDPSYARQAAILLDRVADLYPEFDFRTQGTVYEQPGHAGYVSTWHDACEETRLLALAYDLVFEGLDDDQELVPFLAQMAREHGLDNPKATLADIRRNIEERILRDALTDLAKTRTNFPRQEILRATAMAILSWPDNRDEVLSLIDATVARSTAVDGVTGEKGLANYSASVIQSLAQFLARCGQLEPSFLADLFKRQPRLRETWRFFIDTWCLERYYPLSGDTGAFAEPIPDYVGVRLGRGPAGGKVDFMSGGIEPSLCAFVHQLGQLTQDDDYDRILWRWCGGEPERLADDLFAADPEAVGREVAETIARVGPDLRLGSVNKRQWCLAILRAGEGVGRRAIWLDYDAGGGHGHLDGMNLGLFAYGLDLLPDFGYPPVNFGGWGSPRAVWYTTTAAHNTVLVDGQPQPPGAGETTLWAVGHNLRAVRASAPAMGRGSQYERTIVSLDTGPDHGYIVDVFRVVSGREHARFLRSHFAELSVDGLDLQPAENYAPAAQTRGYRIDSAARPGWSADFRVIDRRKLLPEGSEVHLRCVDLTAGAAAGTAEAWVLAGLFDSTEEAWIPQLMVLRRGDEPLASCFVAVLEPYQHASRLVSVRRLDVSNRLGAPCADNQVAVEITLADGRRDLVLAADVENPLGRPSGGLVCQEGQVDTDGELAWVRRDPAGEILALALAGGSHLRCDDLELTLAGHASPVEIALQDGRATVLAGDPDAILTLTRAGAEVPR